MDSEKALYEKRGKCFAALERLTLKSTTLSTNQISGVKLKNPNVLSVTPQQTATTIAVLS